MSKGSVHPRCVIQWAGCLAILLGVVFSLVLTLQPEIPVYHQRGLRSTGQTIVEQQPYDFTVHVKLTVDDDLMVHGIAVDRVMSYVDRETGTEWRHHTSWTPTTEDDDSEHVWQTSYRLINDSLHRLVHCEQLQIPQPDIPWPMAAMTKQLTGALLPVFWEGLDATVQVLHTVETNETHDLVQLLDDALVGCVASVMGLPADESLQTGVFSTAAATSVAMRPVVASHQQPPTVQDAPVAACTDELLGNGNCDAACNMAQWRWDGGDCCAQTRRVPSRSPYHCLTGPRVLLLHGANWHVADSAQLDKQFSDVTRSIEADVKRERFWGALPTALTAYSRELIFNAHDTVHRDWTDVELQRAYYHGAKAVYDGGGIVFAHAFANLVLAGACHDQGLCGVRWYAIAPAFGGMSTLDLAWPLNGQIINLNQTSVRSMRPGFRNLTSGYLGHLVRERGLLRGALCGSSAFGSGGQIGNEFASLTRLRHGKDAVGSSDGVVSVDECTMAHGQALGPFQHGNATHPWSVLRANHQDLAGQFVEPWPMPAVIDYYVSAIVRG